MNEFDEVAHRLERMMGDPISDSVRGVVRILSASEPKHRRGYQECRLEVVTVAAGVPETRVKTAVVTTPRHWPHVGAELPARISRESPQRMDVNWDALAR